MAVTKPHSAMRCKVVLKESHLGGAKLWSTDADDRGWLGWRTAPLDAISRSDSNLKICGRLTRSPLRTQ